MRSPDDQSGHELLQGLVVLYEETGNATYRAWALDAAYATWAPWLVSYDYVLNGPFSETPFAQLFPGGMLPSSGQPFASPQNREPTPGRCVGSGADVFRLWRYSGDENMLTLLQATVHNQLRFISAATGTMSERVPMGDGCNGAMPGTVYPSNWWPSLSAMLASLDNPGVYLQRDTQRIVVFDHVTATPVAVESSPALNVSSFWPDEPPLAAPWLLRLANPTAFAASVCVFAESTASRPRILSVNAMDRCQRVPVPANAATVVRII